MELTKGLKKELAERTQRLGTPLERATDRFRISVIESGLINCKMEKEKMLRQGLNVSVNQLRQLASDLESQTRQFNLELGQEDIVGFDKTWLINIINKEPKCSDTWEIEDSD